MTELRQWLDDNAEHVSDLDEDVGAPAGMVHLAAVLVLGGLTDSQIAARLRSVRWDDPDENAAVDALLQALPGIRAADAECLRSGAGAGGGANPSGGAGQGLAGEDHS